MGKDPSFVATLIVTVLLFIGITYGAIWLKNYVYKGEDEPVEHEEPTPPVEGSLDALITPEEANIRHGNMIFKAAGVVALVLLIVYIIYNITEKRRAKFY